jgi:type IV pilus assembly protein PilW
MRKQIGLSLIELMIAIALGLILLTGVIQVFLSSKNVYTSQQALSRVQETGRLAIDFLSRDIRMAGYMGCASRTAGMKVTNTLKNPTAFANNFSVAVQGYTAETLAAAGVALTPKPTALTDLIVVRSAAGLGVEITKTNNSGQLFATFISEEVGACADGTNRISGLCQTDILFVSDCAKARIFQASNITGTGAGADVNVVHAASGSPGNDIASWGGASASADETFQPGAEILSATSTTYFIAPSPNPANLTPSLWQNVNGGTSLELLEGVENMSIRYGVDTTAQMDYVPDSYVKAVAVVDWARVVSVQLELLVATVQDKVVPETQKYSFDGLPKTPTDLRLRQVFTTTVGIRSRLF